MSGPLLEICVDSLASARAAARGGADRLEVCANLSIGGTTPGPALVRAVVRETGLPVHALIRPRAGDFLYTDDECAQMEEEIRSLTGAGAQGVVIGCLREDGTLDSAQMRRLIDAAQGAHITLHRAFDMSRDAMEALEAAMALGVHTILTSGAQQDAGAGAECIQALAARAQGKVSVMAGGGVDGGTIRRLYAQGVRAFHLSGKRRVESGMRYRNPRVHMGADGCDEYALWQTDEACVRTAKEALQMAYLRASMPMQDAQDVTEETLLSFVRASRRAYDGLPFARELPPEIYRAYVLQPRVNDERIEDVRGMLFKALRGEVQGLDTAEAALAVNRWCARHVRYAGSDARTRGVRGILNAAEGRCGEESVLAVNALRAVGIAARQVYALYWSHCDDNHAWVEAYVQGRWRYMGACEPEEALDRGWFTAAASRAMLIHTRALGDGFNGADVFYRRGCIAGVNRTHAYAGTTRLRVHVQDGAGAQVRFLVANAGRLRTLYAACTDEAGDAALETGLGGLYVYVQWPDGRAAGRAVDTRDTACVTLAAGDGVERRFYLRAPGGTRMGQEAPETLCASCAQACAQRRARLTEEACSLACGDTALETIFMRAKGNAPEIARFVRGGQDRAARVRLLAALSEKDYTDVTAQTLEDALASGVEEIRVGTEQLEPVYARIRAYMQAHAPGVRTPEDIRAWVDAWICEEAPCGLDYPCRTDNALKTRRCAAGGKRLIARQIARALGTVWEETQARVTLTLDNPDGLMPQEDFALMRLTQDGGAQDVPLEPGQKTVRVESGEYVLFILSRQLDGSVYGHFERLEAAGDRTISLRAERDDTPALIRHEPLEELRGTPYGGEDVVAFLSPGEEPTAHFLSELIALREGEGEDALRFALFARTDGGDALLKKAAALPGVFVHALDAQARAVLDALRVRMGEGDMRLPFAVAVNASGEGLYACANYAVGTLSRLRQVVRTERAANTGKGEN